MMYAVLGFLFFLLIGFFVVVWKASPEWRWYNIVAVCITMILAVLFLFPTAGVLTSRQAWHQVKERLEKQANEVMDENNLLKYGDPNNPEYGQGVIDLSQQLSKFGLEAGRRWRSLRFQGVANNEISLVKAQDNAAMGIDGIPAADDPAAPAAAPAQNTPLIPDGLLVYAFAETSNQQQTLLPTFYLGEFRVSNSTPDSVKLQPAGQLEPNQQQAITSRQAVNWSLYELLPLDAHEPFIVEGSEPSENNVLGRPNDQLISQLLENRVSAETLDAYKQDGRRATDSDPPLSRWWKIQFTKPHNIQVDSPESWEALEGGFYDKIGRAIDSRLQHGENNGELSFSVGDEILVQEEGAKALVQEQDVAKQIDRFYLRPLNDYRFVLRRIRSRLTELVRFKAVLEAETEEINATITGTQSMIVANQMIRQKLEQDLAQFVVEKNSIDAYTQDLRQQVEAMQAEMAKLHQENLMLEQQIKEKHLAIEKRLDALTAVQ